MRCKQHPNDHSSRGGVCASCLRHRLTALLAAQSHRKPDPPPFPRSVSPYISRRKSDTATWRTPQAAPTGSIKKSCNKVGRFASLLSGLFRSKPVKPESDSGPIPCPVEPLSAGRRRTACDRGMSPARCSDGDEDGPHCRGGGSEKRTPARWAHSKSISGFAVCLSPMVRASPNRNWTHKGLPPEAAGESRVPARPHLSTAASFCKNRSRKLADFGRCTYDPTR